MKNETVQIPSVVVVDDSPSSISMYELSARNLDVELATFQSPGDSLAYLREHGADLVFLGVLMRGTDGLTLLKRLRATEQHRTTPIVMVSSKDYAQDRQVARELGASEYLIKPLRSQEIRDIIYRHTGARARQVDGKAP